MSPADTSFLGTGANPDDIVRFSTECEKWDDWNKPAKPFRIHGNTYYVGTCGIAAILVTSDAGHILIDTGTEVGAELVAENIEALGFDLQSVKAITHSHEHFDHIGGFAIMAAKTGARIFAAPGAAMTIMTGKDNPQDPQLGLHEPMAENRSVEVLKAPSDPTGGWSNTLPSHFELALTNAKLAAIHTPGHTPGALTWQWRSCYGTQCRTIVYADSLSPVSRDDYRFLDHPDYVQAYRDGIARIATLDCDILLTPHPSHSKMIERAATATFEGGMTCAQYAQRKSLALDERLAKEQAQ
ncbi:MAG: subclass B3 metallo-beta-lactamase [Erythrobacter sp.]|uniref:subclass B3 metallo-beta-lactamase n=1 Tax=Erythrobacter sp. TaxID=1042 RepID=UPI003A8820FA